MTNVASAITIAEIAALVGDIARANILTALMDGRALTAGELSHHAAVSAATTSGHLAKLLDGQLVAVEKQGRHRYYRLARPEVATAIEALMAVSVDGPVRHRPTGPKDEAMRAARSCYDHLAGRLGVRIAQSLSETGRVVLADGVGVVTEMADGSCAISGSISIGWTIRNVRFAAPASIGVSGVPTSPVALAPPFCSDRWRWIGSPGYRTIARSGSPVPASAVLPIAFGSNTTYEILCDIHRRGLGTRKAAGAGSWSGFGRWSERLPSISGALVLLMGVAVTVRGIWMLGVV